MSTEKDNIKEIGEEEYIIMHLDSRQMEFDGAHWYVTNTRGERGFDEPIPYVTSIELIDSYIPNTFYNVEVYNNTFVFGTELERYKINPSTETQTTVFRANPDDVYAPITGGSSVISRSNLTVYSLDQTIGLTEIPFYDGVTTRNPVDDTRSYVKLKESVSGSYHIVHTMENILAKDGSVVGHAIHFRSNNANDTYPIADTDRRLFIIVQDGNGVEIKSGTAPLSLRIGRTGTSNDGVFDMYTTTDTDDIQDIDVRVFTYARVEFPIKNYTADELTMTTNTFLHDHVRDIFSNVDVRSDIANIMPFEQFVQMHLHITKDDSRRRFTFASNHDHGFFIDFRDEHSIHHEFGFEKKLYTSHTIHNTYVQKMGSVDTDIDSITSTEIASVTQRLDQTERDVIYQVYQAMFFVNKQGRFGIINPNLEKVTPVFVNDYPFDTATATFMTINGTSLSLYAVKLRYEDYIIPFKKSFYNFLAKQTTASEIVIPQKGDDYVYGVAYDKILQNDKTFIDSLTYDISTQVIESTNIYNISGERYVDLVCTEIQNELKRYNAGYNKLYRYYFEDMSNLYTTSSRGNVTDLVLRNPRDFGPIAKLGKLTFDFIRSDGNMYDFKNIPFYISVAIKYLKPTLRVPSEE